MVAFVIIYFIKGNDTGHSSLTPAHRQFNNILYNASETESSVIILHVDKRAQYKTLSTRKQKEFTDKQAYHHSLARELLDWSTLSKNGTLFDVELLDRAIEMEKPVLLTRSNIIVVHLKLKKAFWDDDSNSSCCEVERIHQTLAF